MTFLVLEAFYNVNQRAIYPNGQFPPIDDLFGETVPSIL